MLIDQLRIMGDAFLDKTKEDALLTLSEGFIKVRCAEVALALGWSLQEGVGNKGVADFASIVDGNVVWRRDQRQLSVPDGSSDLAIVSPFEMLIEIKARPDHGTKSQAQFEQMDADVARISADIRGGLFFVFEHKAYRSFSNEKLDERGRRPKTSAWFHEHFPKLSSIPTANWQDVEAIRAEKRITLSFRRCQHHRPDQTILVVGCQKEARAECMSFITENILDFL